MLEKILNELDKINSTGHFKPSWDSLEEFCIPTWYQQAKLGIFIHWGVYSVPAYSSEWYSRNMYIEGSDEYNHHVKTYGSHKQFGYKDFIPLLTFENYNPDEWAELFKQSGAKYVIPVAEHHDGFQMYQSDLSAWNAYEMGPKRDVVAELAAAVQKAGLTFGLSSHRAEHYYFMGEGTRFDSDVPHNMEFYGPAKIRMSYDDYLDCAPDKEFLEDWLARCCEIIDKYKPQVLYFDTWIMNLAFKPYLKKLAAYYYNRGLEWNMEVAINYKHDAMPVGCGVLDVECGQLNDVRPMLWQKDTTITKDSWGYIEGHKFRTTKEIIRELIDVVSKNGALLLNIGPRKDGTIPKEEQDVLLSIGKWLNIYGEAIFDTTPFLVCGEGPSIKPGMNMIDYSTIEYTSDEIRFTLKGDTLYIFAMSCPEDGSVLVKTLSKSIVESTIGSIDIIGVVGSEACVKWTLTEQGLTLQASHVQTGDIVIFKAKLG